MPWDDGRDIIIVSDTHLSVSVDERTGVPGHTDDFFCDTALVRFLDNLRERARDHGRGVRLVILGDLFDFLQLEIGSLGWARGRLDTSEEASLAHLERMVDAHAELFRALARWVTAGLLLDIVPGNHDIELMRPSVQDRFKALMVRFSGRAEDASGLRFYPWIYYVPGVLYAEHGHQYHDINWFATLLQPYRPQDPAQLDLPPASYFDGYRFPFSAGIQRLADRTEPPLRYLAQAMRTPPMRGLVALGRYAHMMRVILYHAAARANGTLSARRSAYQEEALRRYAVQVGLCYDTLVAIDAVAAATAMHMKQRLLRQAMLVRPPERSSAYLRTAVPVIHGLLHAAKQDVPYYVFGHTHIAERIPLVSTAATPCYLNSGTWAPLEPGPGVPAGRRQQFSFVQICHEPGAFPRAQLVLWNDVTGQCETLD